MGKTQANNSNSSEPPPKPEFGDLLDLELLLALAQVDESDLESAAAWFDEHASPEWRGALDSEP